MVLRSKSLSFELPCSPSWESEQRMLATDDAVDALDATLAHPSCAQLSRAQLGRFLDGLKPRLTTTEYNTVCDVLLETLSTPYTAEDSGPAQFSLALGHICAAVACSKNTCELCVNSHSRPCPSLFKQKYLLGDSIVPACGASASVRLVRVDDPADEVSPADMRMLPPFVLQVCAMPVQYYEQHRNHLPWDSIHECKTITKPSANGRSTQAVLGCRGSGHVEDDGFVSFSNPLKAAHIAGIPPEEVLAPEGVTLPDVFFPNGNNNSAEALLETKRPLLVLVVRAVHACTGEPISAVGPAVSTPFHVATRRTKCNEKAYIPSMDQEVSVLENIGGACIDKLRELPKHLAARKSSKAPTPRVALPASIPGGSVTTVGHVAALLDAVEHDSVAKGSIFRNILKLNDVKLAEVEDQVRRAVHPDSHLRVFYCGPYATAPLPGLLPGGGAVDVGLIFQCMHGTVQLTERGICGVVMRSRSAAEACTEVVVPSDHLIQAPHLKPALFTHAVNAWRSRGHPGWGFYKFQGRRTGRMPPAGAGLYAVDPSCFTPSHNPAGKPGGVAGDGSDGGDGGHTDTAGSSGCGTVRTLAEDGTTAVAGDVDPGSAAQTGGFQDEPLGMGHAQENLTTPQAVREAPLADELGRGVGGTFGGARTAGHGFGGRNFGAAMEEQADATYTAAAPRVAHAWNDPLAGWLEPMQARPGDRTRKPAAEPPPATAGAPRYTCTPPPLSSWMNTVAMSSAMHGRSAEAVSLPVATELPMARAAGAVGSPMHGGNVTEPRGMRRPSGAVESWGPAPKRAKVAAAEPEPGAGTSWLSFADFPEVHSAAAAAAAAGQPQPAPGLFGRRLRESPGSSLFGSGSQGIVPNGEIDNPSGMLDFSASFREASVGGLGLAAGSGELDSAGASGGG